MLSLIIGELVPKQIALRDPEGVAVKVAPAMTVLARIGAPLVWLLDVSGDAVLLLLGYKAEPEKKVTDEEIRTLIAEAESAGVIEPGERAMISGVMRLGDRPVRAMMTTRTDVDMIDLTASPAEIRAAIRNSRHSRLPAHEGDAGRDRRRGAGQGPAQRLPVRPRARRARLSDRGAGRARHGRRARAWST